MAEERPEMTTRPPVSIDLMHLLDPEVLKKIHEFMCSNYADVEKSTVISISGHGRSLWTRTARIDVECKTSSDTLFIRSFFIKTTRGFLGKGLVRSEDNGLRDMYSLKDTVGYITPAPVAWGAYSMEPDVYFLLCTFQHMEDTLPPPGVFAPEVAKLHRSSQLNGQPPQKFGKQLGSRTFHGNVRISHAFVDTWEEYFIKTTRTLLRQEKHAQGPNEEIERMAEPFFEKVIPRLLRPLQTGGRSIAPCIIHGDLWHGNVGTDKKTGRPVIFDPACFYAHNEYELGVWSQPWNKINNTYREEYHKHFPPSEPVEDCDDRSALYGVRVNILDSILYKDDKTYRTRLIAGMRELVDKFPGGFEEWEASPGASKA